MSRCSAGVATPMTSDPPSFKPESPPDSLASHHESPAHGPGMSCHSGDFPSLWLRTLTTFLLLKLPKPVKYALRLPNFRNKHFPMTAATPSAPTTAPEFCQGIQFFADSLPGWETYASQPALAEGATAIRDLSDKAAVYQTLLAADALRYLTLQITSSKASGHPGGFASISDAIAALVMLGYKNIITEVGHHAPGFYSNVFLDRSLEDMGISTVQQLRDRFRETHGLLGHLSGQIPGLLNPAGPLGQGQHFAMAGAKLNPGVLFPVTIGDGGIGEPYVMSSFGHFNTAYPNVTNFLPILVWNGYSQEHHSMVSTKTNSEMRDYWSGNGFQEIILIDAKDYDDANQPGDYVDSTQFSLEKTPRVHPSPPASGPDGRPIRPQRNPNGVDCQTTERGRRSQTGGPIP